MIAVRVIPCLLLSGTGLVKTYKFKEPKYLGDPRNAVKIFNEREVDELMILDINATILENKPQFDLLREIVSEAFMPVGYGGGLSNVQDAAKMLQLGVEKVVINSASVERPEYIKEAAREFGSQSVVVSIDVKKSFFSRYEIHTRGGRKNTKLSPAAFAQKMEDFGAGEILLNSIDRDGTQAGYDLDLIREVSKVVRVPVVAVGGAGNLLDFRRAVQEGGASAVAAGSIFVFHGKHRAVLISYPEQIALAELFEGT
jgi:imidazole glycerol-phosphate synthase subunit HisF